MDSSSGCRSSRTTSLAISKFHTIRRSFPIQEYGMNYESQPLQRHEIEAMKADKEILDRVVQSYRVMLDFYGMQLKSPETGLLARVEPERKYVDRTRNLARE